MAEERIALSMKERERLKVFTRSRKDIYGRSMPPAVCGLIRSKIFEQIWFSQWKKHTCGYATNRDLHRLSDFTVRLG
jgi:hypothetical protein